MLEVQPAMLFKEIQDTRLEALINSAWVTFEQKMDGTRCLVKWDGEQITFHQRNGSPLKHAAAALHFEGLKAALIDIANPEDRWIIDGELMFDTGRYYMFDLQYLEIKSTVTNTVDNHFSLRRMALGVMFAAAEHPLYISRLEDAPAGKRRLVDQVRASGGEGIMVKQMDSKYLPGKRSDAAWKVKFTSTADVVVTKVTRPDAKHGNFEFAVYGEDALGLALVPLGSCSAIGKPEVAVGDVIEVRYLSYVPGGALVQPRMVRVREDKAVLDCTIDQLQVYSKEVHGE